MLVGWKRQNISLTHTHTQRESFLRLNTNSIHEKADEKTGNEKKHWLFPARHR